MSEADNPMQRVMTKCWEDEAFKERLPADPAATLPAEGVEVPEDVRTMVIPLPPTGALSDGELRAMSGGAGTMGMLHPRSDDPLGVLLRVGSKRPTRTFL